MSEETKQTPASDAPTAASNTAGAGQGRPGAASAADVMGGAVAGEPKFRGKRRRKVSYLTINKIYSVDYKDVSILRRFINEHGKILSSRITGNTAKQQRMIARAIRRAREMALLPFVVTEMSAERPMRGARGPRRDYGDRNDRGGDRAEREAPREAPEPAAAE